ncbi:MAG: shikimate dehydrogenase, partial [Calditrichaeota bacterium]|nr:shikimate dehydrogenase [Calditrichota bacterium]
RKNRVVLDVIYNPAETRFLRIARERGCITISGMEMFLVQAARQFEIFTGESVSREEILDVWQRLN